MNRAICWHLPLLVVWNACCLLPEVQRCLELGASSWVEGLVVRVLAHPLGCGEAGVATWHARAVQHG